MASSAAGPLVSLVAAGINADDAASCAENSRSDAENSCKNSENSQSAALHLDAAARKMPATFKGTVQRFIPKLGYGFITPADAASFPQDVKRALAKQIRDAKACKVPIVGADALYFSEKDVTHDGGVELTAGAQVTFQVRSDNKGPSAFDVLGV